MWLSLKLALAFVAVTSAVMLGYGVLRVRREAALFDRDMRRDHLHVGHTLALSLGEVWQGEGEGRAKALVARINQEKSHVEIRWRPVGTPGLDRRRDLQWIDRAGSDRTLRTLVPVMGRGRVIGGVELAESLAEEQRYTSATVRRAALTTLIIVGVTAAVALALGYWLVGAPVAALVHKARQVGQGRFDGQVELQQHDELGSLAREMDAMGEQLAQATRRAAAETSARIIALEQLRHSDRLVTVGKLAAGLAHELGSPLNVVSGRAQLIVEGQTPGQEPENARIIIRQVDRMARIIRQLLNFARRQPARKASCELGQVVSGALDLLSTTAAKHEVTFVRTGPDPSVMAEVDADQIHQVLVNLIVNGIQAMPRGGTIRVEVGHGLASPPPGQGRAHREYAWVAVEDQGAGMTPEVLDHVFEPFFTTKDVGQGTGLGLSVAYGIVQEHGGWIAADSKPGRGSRFTMYLPVSAEDGGPGEKPLAPETPHNSAARPPRRAA